MSQEQPENVSRERAILQILIAIALGAMTLALFWPARQHEFIRYDDPLYVTENVVVQKGLTAEGLKYAFATGDASNWHPLTWLSHMLDSEISLRLAGSRDAQHSVNAAVHHTTSIALHALNAGLLFLVLCRLTRATWPCAFGAAFFALHPLRVESVAWVAERKDLLSALFGLLAIFCYARFARTGGVWRYILVVFWFALSLMAKPMLVTLPFVLLLLDWWPLERWRPVRLGRLIIEKIPLLALTLASCIVTYIMQQRGGSVEASGMIPLSARLGNAAVSYMRYLGKTFWPTDLAVLYPHPGHWPIADVLIACAGLAVISIIALAFARRVPALPVGWFWFVGTLVPVIGIVQVGAQSMADRYTYFPHIGLFMAIVWSSLAIFGRERSWLLTVVGVAAAGAFCVETRNTLRRWHNTETLYRHVLEVTAENWVVELNMGTLLLNQPGRASEAEAHFRNAVRIKPDSTDARYSLATWSFRTGRVKDAIAELQRVVELNPDHALGLNDLAWILATQADPLLRNSDQAVKLAEHGNSLVKNDAALLDTLAAAYANAERFDEAIRTAERALDLARQANMKELAMMIEQHLESYRSGRPIREGRPA